MLVKPNDATELFKAIFERPTVIDCGIFMTLRHEELFKAKMEWAQTREHFVVDDSDPELLQVIHTSLLDLGPS